LIEAGSLQSVWKELEAMKAEGICKVIGVCNFSINALQQLLTVCDVKPAINQVERHPMLPQYDLLEYCQSQGIVVQAHTPLGHGNKVLMENEKILRVANESQLTPAQVLLLWNIQQGVPVITKFTSDEHSRDIIPILQSKISLSPRQMKVLDEISASSAEEEVRFVAPPFMYKPGATYSWGDKPPQN
jgi:diketogulonate reductase-like aldo/keto reductase